VSFPLHIKGNGYPRKSALHLKMCTLKMAQLSVLHDIVHVRNLGMSLLPLELLTGKISKTLENVIRH